MYAQGKSKELVGIATVCRKFRNYDTLYYDFSDLYSRKFMEKEPSVPKGFYKNVTFPGLLPND